MRSRRAQRCHLKLPRKHLQQFLQRYHQQYPQRLPRRHLLSQWRNSKLMTQILAMTQLKKERSSLLFKVVSWTIRALRNWLSTPRQKLRGRCRRATRKRRCHTCAKAWSTWAQLLLLMALALVRISSLLRTSITVATQTMATLDLRMENSSVTERKTSVRSPVTNTQQWSS